MATKKETLAKWALDRYASEDFAKASAKCVKAAGAFCEAVVAQGYNSPDLRIVPAEHEALGSPEFVAVIHEEIPDSVVFQMIAGAPGQALGDVWSVREQAKRGVLYEPITAYSTGVYPS